MHSDEREIPKYMRQLDHDRVYKLDDSSFADNFGKVYIPLNIQKGAYKIFYCRKKRFETSSDRRSKSKPISDYEVLGSSTIFNFNKFHSSPSNITISHHSSVSSQISEKFNESDATKQLYQFSISDQNSSFKNFSSLNSLQKQTIKNSDLSVFLQ